MSIRQCPSMWVVYITLIWCIGGTALGQPTLERLEKSIRERSDGTADPAAAAKPRTEIGRPAGYLGLTADDANDRGRGVRVLTVRAAGPAATAGLKANDLITAIAGVRVREMSEMAEIMALFPAGDTVAMHVLRDGKQQQVKVTLGQPSAANGATAEVVGEPIKEAARPAAAVKAPVPVAPPTIQQLQNRIEQLERRIEQLEKALAQAAKKP